jgi:hypothetical protein
VPQYWLATFDTPEWLLKIEILAVDFDKKSRAVLPAFECA